MKRVNLARLLFLVLGVILVIVGIISDEISKISLAVVSFGVGIVFANLVIELAEERHGR